MEKGPMNLTYPFKHNNSGDVYTFQSIGRNVIDKLVTFKQVRPGYYRVALLDLDEHGDPLPDTHVSNNGDRDKVLYTAFNIIEHFLSVNTGAGVYITASDNRRMHYYRKLLFKDLMENKRFEAVGIRADGVIEHINPKGEYDALLVVSR
jgi:hypothetical protein